MAVVEQGSGERCVAAFSATSEDQFALQIQTVLNSAVITRDR